MDIKHTTVSVGDKKLYLETGRFAQQATAAVIARIGDTMVQATVVMGQPKPELGYFPLQVEYQEKLYAGGKIKGSRWVKRDGRPTDEVILKGRLIDRSIRPLFPDGLTSEVQIIITVLSADGENDADIPAMYAVSTALALSPIPWDGPIGAVRIGYSKAKDEVMLNPTYEQRKESDLDLVLSASKDAVMMVEAGAKEISEAKMLELFKAGETSVQESLVELASFIEDNKAEKIEYTPTTLDQTIVDQIKSEVGSKIPDMVKAWASLQPTGKSDLVASLLEKHQETLTKSQISEAIDTLMKKEVRRMTAEDGKRPDGRSHTEIRPLSSSVGLLPRTHGSAEFKRGSTQALTITTLGSPSLNQLIESMEGEAEKRYIHHYSMPPFSVGEAGRVGWPSRREVGHGALAERAIEPMLPTEEEFPYTIHVVSEIMSSNGSTSMASVCGSTLSLMDAGVPIKKPVSGIAMGLIKEGDKYIVLSDIQGMEDHTGDMDFKVAGTKDGITAMQMDTKIAGIPTDVLSQALEQARAGRLHILDSMLSTLAEPRDKLSQYAPKIITISIPPERIGELIGPGGKNIKKIIAETGADVDVDDDGKVFISTADEDAMNMAKKWITDMMREIEVGEEFEGEVVRIENYGAFVNLIPGKDGLLHVSNMSTGFVKDPHGLVKEGDMIKVRVNEVSPEGKIGLTTLTKEQEEVKKQERKAAPASSGFGNRSGFGGRGGGADRGGRRGGGGSRRY